MILFILPHYILKLLDSCYKTRMKNEYKEFSFFLNKIFVILNSPRLSERITRIKPRSNQDKGLFKLIANIFNYFKRKSFFKKIQFFNFIIHQISGAISPSHQSTFQLSLKLLVRYRSP